MNITEYIHFLDMSFKTSTGLLFVLHENFNIRYANEEFFQQYLITDPEEFIKKNKLTDLIHESAYVISHIRYKEIIATGFSELSTQKAIRLDGSPFWIRIQDTRVDLDEGYFLLTILEDLTEEIEKNQQLELAQNKLKDTFLNVISSLPNATVVLDEHLNVVSANKNYDRIFRDNEDSTDNGIEFIRDNIRKETYNFNFNISHHFFNVKSQQLATKEWIISIYEVSDLVNKNLELKELANIDSLTGAFNRRGFFEHWNIPNAEGQSSYVLLLDIDNFKNINDVHGHDIGDQVLKQFTEIIRHNVRTTDLLARYGGEEFVLLLRNITKGSAITAANNLIKMVAGEIFNADTGNFNITTSIGMAEATSDIDETPESKGLIIEKIVKNSDIALYKAKVSGKNRLECFWEINQ